MAGEPRTLLTTLGQRTLLITLGQRTDTINHACPELMRWINDLHLGTPTTWHGSRGSLQTSQQTGPCSNPGDV
jgi:hypothetical protein